MAPFITSSNTQQPKVWMDGHYVSANKASDGKWYIEVNGVKKEVSKEEMKDRVIGYYDAVGIKHFYLEVDEMDDEELKALYINSFAKE